MTTRVSSWFAPVFISLIINLFFLCLVQVLTYVRPPGKKADFTPIQVVPLDTATAPEIARLEPNIPTATPSPPLIPSAPKSDLRPLPVMKEEQPLAPAQTMAAPQVEELGLDETRQVEPEPGVETPLSAGPSPLSSGEAGIPGGAGEGTPGPYSDIGSRFAPLSKLTKIPTFITRTEPVYPERSRMTGKEASVMVEIDLDADGSIIEVRIIKSGGKEFDSAVRDAVMASSFTPGYIRESPVPVRVQIPYVFKLR